MSSADLIVIRTAQALGITLSSMLAGANFGYSFAAIPSMQLREVPGPVAIKQFIKLYNVGKVLAISATVGGVLSNSFVLYRALYSWPTLAWSAPRTDLLVAAIIAQASFIAYTVVLMESGTNKRLFDFKRDAKHGKLTTELEGAKVREELETWKWFNGFRGCLPALGAVLGFWSTLG